MKKRICALMIFFLMLGNVGCSPAEQEVAADFKQVMAMNTLAIDQIIEIQLDQSRWPGSHSGNNNGWVKLKLVGQVDLGKGIAQGDVSYCLGEAGEFKPLTKGVAAQYGLYFTPEGPYTLISELKNHFATSSDFEQEAKAYLGNYNYVASSLQNNVLGLMAAVFLEGTSTGVLQSIFPALIESSNGFTTDSIQKTAEGYEIKFNTNQMVDIVDRWLIYAKNNPAQTSKLLTVVGKSLYDYEFASQAEAMAEVKDIVQEWTDQWSYIKNDIIWGGESQNNDLETVIQLKKDESRQLYTVDLTLNSHHLNQVHGITQIKSKLVITPSKVSIEPIVQYDRWEDFIAGYIDIMMKYTHYESIIIDLGYEGWSGYYPITLKVDGVGVGAGYDEPWYPLALHEVGGSYYGDIQGLNELLENQFIFWNEQSKGFYTLAGEEPVALTWDWYNGAKRRIIKS